MPARVGVDVSATAVRVARVRAGAPPRVTAAAVAPLPRGAVTADGVASPAVVAAALARAGASMPGRVRNVAVSAADPTTRIQPVRLPAGLGEEEARTFADARTGPWPADAIVAVAPSRSRGSDDPVDAAAASVGEETVTRLLEAVELAGMRAVLVDNAAAATARVHDPPGRERDVVAVVDVGASRTMVVVRDGAQLRAAAVLPLGGDRVTEEVMAATSSSVDDAEDRKRVTPLADPVGVVDTTSMSYVGETGGGTAPSRVAHAARCAALMIVERTAAVVEADGRAYPDRRVQRVALAGAASRHQGLDVLLGDRLELPVRRVLPSVDLTGLPSRSPLRDPDSGAPSPHAAQQLALAAASGWAAT